MKPRGSLLSQLLIVFSVFAVVIGAAVAVGYVAVARQSRAANQFTGHYQVLQEADGKIGEAFTRAQLSVLGYSLTGERGFLLPLGAARVQYERRLATLERRTPRGLRGLVRDQARAGGAWFALVPKIMAVRPGTPAAKALLGRSAGLTQMFFAANVRMQVSLTARVRLLSSSGLRALSTGLAWSAAAVGVALLLVLAGSLSTLRTITRPLRGLTATVRRLTSGDHGARAVVTGSAEVREVARAVNTQADESDRLRQQEAQSNRLRAMARAGGIRIREHLAADDVIHEAHAALAECVEADLTYVILENDGKLTPSVGHENAWRLPEMFYTELPPDGMKRLHGLFHRHVSDVMQDVAGEEGEHLPPWVRDQLRAAGIGSYVLTPFGVGEQMLGFVVVDRLGSGRPWSAAEVDAVESIAADVGRGLYHARLYEAENRLVEELKSLDRAKSDFFATVSHELRAPLTSIEGYVETFAAAKAGPVTDGQRRMLEAVDRGAVRLRGLIDDVFTLSKLESGAFTTTLRPVDMAQVIAGAAEAVQPSVTAEGLTLTADCPAGGLMVEGDAGQLDRVLVNLLSNAVKFTPGGGRIAVTGAVEDGSAVVAVSDTGIGIPASDQQELFARFFRASNARERSIPGTGLGLAIVRTIVDNHRGDVGLRSQENKGTTVTVRLPLLPGGDAGRGPPEMAHAGPVAPLTAEGPGAEWNRAVADPPVRPRGRPS